MKRSIESIERELAKTEVGSDRYWELIEQLEPSAEREEATSLRDIEHINLKTKTIDF